MPCCLSPRSTSREMSESSRRERAVHRLEQDHLAAQAGKARGDLRAGGPAADDRQAGRQLLKRPGLLGPDHAPAELHPGDRTRHRAGCEDHGLRGDQLSVDAHRAVGGQRRIALDQVDVVFLEQAGHARGERGDDLLAAGLHGGVVDLHAAHLQPVLLRVAYLREQVGRAQHRLGGDAGVVQAAPPDLVALDDRGLFPELRGADRGDVAARSGADHDAVIGSCRHFG